MDKIVHLVPALNYGGSERMVFEISQFQAIGNEVHIIVFSKQNQEMQLSPGVNVHYCTSGTFVRKFLKDSIVDLEEYDSLIRMIEPDYIHSHSYYTDIFMLNGNIGSAELISHWHLQRHVLNPSLRQWKLFKFIKDWLDKRWYINLLYTLNVKIITISNFSSNIHKKYLNTKLYPQVFELENCISLNDKYCSKLNIDPLNVKLISIGRLEKVKNHIFLLNVMGRLKNNNKINFNLDIYGDGKLKDTLYKEILDQGLQNKVFLKGNVDKIREILCHYDIYLHSSIEEQFGLTILEALNSGLPCISLDSGAVNELILDKKTGLIIKENSVQAYADAIIELVSNVKLYHHLSKTAFKFSLQYSIKEYIFEMNKIYKSQIENRIN